jgi:hypothetical protein
VTIALEAARTVEEGIVTDPREADVGSILGFGFAPYTGGTLSYIDGMGVKDLRGALRKAGRQVRQSLRADAALKDMAAKGETFYKRLRWKPAANSPAASGVIRSRHLSFLHQRRNPMSNAGKPEKPVQKTTPAKQAKTPAKTAAKKQPTPAPAKTGAASAKPVLLSGGNPLCKPISPPCPAGKATLAAASTR